MKKIQDNSTDLGPWRNLIDEFTKDEIIQQKKNNRESLYLPRMIRKHQDPVERQKKPKSQLEKPIKIHSFKLDINEQKRAKELKEGRQSKTISFDRLMSSFYKRKNAKEFMKDKNLVMKSLDVERKLTNKISKIDLLCQDQNSQKHTKNTYTNRSVEYQFAKKRSLIDMFKHLKNPSIVQAYDQFEKRQDYKTQFQQANNLLDIERKLDRYVSSNRRVLSYAKKK